MIHPLPASPGATLRELWRDGPVLMPGAFSPLTALAAAKQGAKAVYLSGGAITNNVLGLPDIALVTLDELAGVASRTCQVVPVPVLCDADTGFGDGWNVVRCVAEMERAGLAGIHIEDQVTSKRCGHLDGKELVPTAQMVAKLKAASGAKRDPSFVVVARTDARGVEGLESAVQRARAYVDAGADAVFPEGLISEEEFEQFREAVPGPLLANMTEFGKTPLISADRFGEFGYQMVIFPVTALRVMLKSVQAFYGDLMRTGTQAGWMADMVTRAELYDLIDYPEFTQRDVEWSSKDHRHG